MKLTLYNSLTKKKQAFEPLKSGEVSMYSCGPTVYDHVHIGNLRAFITADLLQRVLRTVGEYDVHWVMNITDIDDKMIARAAEEYPGEDPATAVKKLADTYEAKFLKDLSAVGIQTSDLAERPHATDYIQQMQVIIRDLLKKKIAYISDGSVYFSLAEYEKSGHDYGRLVQVDYDPQTRIDDQEQKQGAGDFALWKAYKPGEPAWDFDVEGENLRGRPGWHIECSAMSTDILGREFDIHTGGIDLKFPHHENEIAQCEGSLARYWVHNEFLTVDEAKMAKSAGNFTTLDDIDSPLAFRMLVLSAQYRSQMDASADGLLGAENRLKSLREWASRVINNESIVNDDHIADLKLRFDAAVADDLNTPQALAVLSEAERANVYSPEMRRFIEHVDAALGLQLLHHQKDLRADSAIAELLVERERARAEQAFERSDQLRAELTTIGVGIEDTPDGQVIWQLAD